MRYLLCGLLLFLLACSSDSSDEATDCGGLIGLSCGESEFCNYPIGSCGAEDLTGTCVVKPNVCLEIFTPVCGCDDKTYPNPCAAAAKGVSLVKSEACKK